MKKSLLFGLTFIAMALVVVLAPSTLMAQDEEDSDEEDEQEEDEGGEGDESEGADVESEPPNVGIRTFWGDEEITEVLTGHYMNMRIGGRMFLSGDYGDAIDPGMAVSASYGYDIVPEYFSLGLDFGASFHGAGGIYDEVGEVRADAPVTGDCMLFSTVLVFDVHYFVTERIKLYLAPEGGLMLNWQAEDTDIGLMDYMAGARLGIEYYAGLRHFSIGLDIEPGFIITAGSLFLNIGPTVRYTF